MSTAIKKARSKFQPTGQWIRSDARLAVYLRDGLCCLVCLKDLRDAAPTDITLDHVVCKVDGGSNKPDNIYTCCRTCNCSRGDKPLKLFVGPETLKHIKRNLKRSMTKYRTLAKALISGETGFEGSFKSL